jgi:hypothetical protein
MGTRPHVHSAILQDTQATMGTRYARELRTYSWSAGLESVMGLHSGTPFAPLVPSGGIAASGQFARRRDDQCRLAKGRDRALRAS